MILRAQPQKHLLRITLPIVNILPVRSGPVVTKIGRYSILLLHTVHLTPDNPAHDDPPRDSLSGSWNQRQTSTRQPQLRRPTTVSVCPFFIFTCYTRISALAELIQLRAKRRRSPQARLVCRLLVRASPYLFYNGRTCPTFCAGSLQSFHPSSRLEKIIWLILRLGCLPLLFLYLSPHLNGFSVAQRRVVRAGAAQAKQPLLQYYFRKVPVLSGISPIRFPVVQ